MGLKKRLLKESFAGRSERTDRGSMPGRNRQFVPGGWSLVRERVLTTGPSVEGRYSERSGVCRTVELLGRSVKVKMVCKTCGGA